MEWFQVLIIFISFGIFLGYIMGKILRHILNIESNIKIIAARSEKHEQRIDMLYQMFIDLLKEQRK